MSCYFEGMIFSGDTLLIRGCGRTDFQGQTSSTVGMERMHSPRLGDFQTLENFKMIMANLKLTNPAKIYEALPANRACGHVQKIET